MLDYCLLPYIVCISTPSETSLVSTEAVEAIGQSVTPCSIGKLGILPSVRLSDKVAVVTGKDGRAIALTISTPSGQNSCLWLFHFSWMTGKDDHCLPQIGLRSPSDGSILY